MTGEGEGPTLTLVWSQAARTKRATMPTTRSMWSNVSRGAAPRVRLGAPHPGHAVSRGRLSDRGRRRDRGVARAPRRLLTRHGLGRPLPAPACPARAYAARRLAG